MSSLAADRKFHRPLGRRPDDHPGLSDLGLRARYSMTPQAMRSPPPPSGFG